MKKISHKRLDNGLHYYGQYDSASHVFRIGVKTGSGGDPLNRGGLAHLTEHLVFGASRKYPADLVEDMVEQYMGGWSGDVEVFTTHERTDFGTEQLQSRADMFKCMEMYIDLLKNPVIEKADFLRELAAVLQEYSLSQKDPQEVMYGRLHQMLYGPDHPVNKPVDCDPAHLLSMTVSHVRSFYKRFYVPSNMFFIAMGPRFSQVGKWAHKYFGDWPRTSTPMPTDEQTYAWEPLDKTRREEIVMPLAQHHLGMAWPTRFYDAKDKFIVQVLARLLARRMYRRLRYDNYTLGKGTYRANSDTLVSSKHGMLRAWLASTDLQYVRDAESIILEECEKLKNMREKTHGVWARRSIAALRREYWSAFRIYPGTLCELIAEAACNGDEELEVLNNWQDYVNAITTHKLAKAAQEYLTPNFASVLLRTEEPPPVPVLK